jgi:hypothetical protein
MPVWAKCGDEDGQLDEELEDLFPALSDRQLLTDIRRTLLGTPRPDVRGFGDQTSLDSGRPTA